MSTTTLAPPQTPVEFVKSLSPEAKGEVLFALLQELIAMYGGQGLISFETPDGKPFGHYVPPEVEKVRSAAALAEMPEEVRQRMTKPLPADFDPDDVLTDAELWAIMRGRACHLADDDPTQVATERPVDPILDHVMDPGVGIESPRVIGVRPLLVANGLLRQARSPDQFGLYLLQEQIRNRLIPTSCIRD